MKDIHTKTWLVVTGNMKAVMFDRTSTGLEPRLIEWTDDYTGPDRFVFRPDGGRITVWWYDDGRYAFR